jgi:hypothetical protein
VGGRWAWPPGVAPSDRAHETRYRLRRFRALSVRALPITPIPALLRRYEVSSLLNMSANLSIIASLMAGISRRREVLIIIDWDERDCILSNCKYRLHILRIASRRKAGRRQGVGDSRGAASGWRRSDCDARFQGRNVASVRTAAGNARKSAGPLVFTQCVGNQTNCLELQQY